MISVDRPHLHISTATHEGMRGKNNEDRFGVSAYQLSPNDPTPVVFAVLCDGIGGHRAGEVAAEIAVETIRKAVASSEGENPQLTLRLGIQSASQAIREQADKDSGRKGMGATCVSAWVIGDRLYMAYVGDSRMYLLSKGAIRQVTIDHTWIQEALEFGVLTLEQARNHPNQHVIRRYLGSQEIPEVDFRLKLSDTETDEQAVANQGLRLQPGDRLVLCSDGLSDLVSPEEVLQAVQNESREQAPLSLVALANQRGGHDNITVVLLEVPGEAASKTVFAPGASTTAPLKSATPTVLSVPTAVPTAMPPPAVRPATKSKRWAAISCLAAAVLMAMVVLLGIALVWYLSSSGILTLPWITTDTPTPTLPILTPPALAFPSETPLPTVATPTLPAVTNTPWPTNTLAPTSTFTLQPSGTSTLQPTSTPTFTLPPP